MVLAYPHWLWLLVLAPALAALDWRGGGPRRLPTSLLRGACVAMITLAMARPMLPWQSREATTVVLIDLGPGVSGNAIERSRAFVSHPPAGRLQLVAYSTRAEVLTNSGVLDNASALASLRQRLAKSIWSDDVKSGGSNLADALRLAGTQIPSGGRGNIRLFGGGRNDHGDAEAESWRLAQRGIAVVSEVADVAGGETLRVRSVDAPATARLGQTVRVTITLESTAAATAHLSLTAGDEKPITVTAAVTPGMNTLRADLPLEKGGLTPIYVQASAGSNAAPASTQNTYAALFVDPPANVLLVQSGVENGGADVGLAEAAAALLGPGAAVHAVTPSQLAGPDVGQADAIILADVPADQLSVDMQASIRRAVARGTGLLVTGAARSFGPGGYDDSTLSPLLPVKMPQQMESIEPSTALVLIIDSSGSMQGDRINLAKEVARLALSHLKPHDKVGIVEFYGGKRWAAPIQSAGNLGVIHRALDRLTAGGGTTLYPAVEEAAFALRNVRTRSKHVLICSDGFVENAPFSSLVRQMADDGIVVSTAQVAPSDGTPNQMPDIARWGNGRYYTVPDQFELPDLSFKQPQISLTSPLVRTSATVAAGDDPLVRTVARNEADFGTVGGYVRTQSKPTADVLLRAGGADPLLVRWRYGAGYVAVLPTQLGSIMTGGLQDKPAFTTLLAGLVRQIDDNRGSALQITTRVRPGGIEADITSIDGLPAAGAVQLTLLDAAGQVERRVSREAIAAGHWNVWLADVTAGAYTLMASTGDTAQGQAGVSVPKPVAIVATDHDELNRVAAFDALAAEHAAALPPARTAYFDAQKFLAAAAALLLLSQVAVRRWPSVGVRAFPALIP